MDRIDDGHQDEELPAAYQAALAWADVILAGGSTPDPDLQARLLTHFTDAQIMELTYAMGAFIGFSKQLIMLGLEPEEMPVTGVPIPRPAA